MFIISKQKIYLIIFLVIILIIGLIFLGARPLFDKIKATSEEIQKKQALLLSFNQQEDYITKLQMQFDEIKDKTPLVSANFLSCDEPVKFITFLEDIADKTSSSLEIDILDPEVALENEGKKQEFLSFQLVVENKFQGLMNFLVYLENMDYYVDVNSINIELLKNGQRKSRTEGPDFSEKIETILKIKVHTRE